MAEAGVHDTADRSAQTFDVGGVDVPGWKEDRTAPTVRGSLDPEGNMTGRIGRDVEPITGTRRIYHPLHLSPELRASAYGMKPLYTMTRRQERRRRRDLKQQRPPEAFGAPIGICARRRSDASNGAREPLPMVSLPNGIARLLHVEW